MVGLDGFEGLFSVVDAGIESAAVFAMLRKLVVGLDSGIEAVGAD